MAAILILDDEEAICSALRFALEDEYQVYTSTDVQTAFQVLASQDVNLVLLDQRLGAVDGLEVLQSIRIRYPQTLVIAMTAYGSIESSVEAMQRGAYYYLTKPLVTAELRMLIRKALDFKVAGLAGCLVSHEHKDHCRAVPDLIRAGVDVCHAGGTARRGGRRRAVPDRLLYAAVGPV